jgi:hypothetical protein
VLQLIRHKVHSRHSERVRVSVAREPLLVAAVDVAVALSFTAVIGGLRHGPRLVAASWPYSYNSVDEIAGDSEYEDFPLMQAGDQVLLFLRPVNRVDSVAGVIVGGPMGRLIVDGDKVTTTDTDFVLPISSGLTIADVEGELGPQH